MDGKPSDDGNSCGSVSSTSVGVNRRCSTTNNTNNSSGNVPSPRGATPTLTPTPNVPTPTVTPTLRSTPSPSVAPNSVGGNKIISRNVNGTMTVTSAPSNEAELQLYRVMQRASLLSYYDTLLEMGNGQIFMDILATFYYFGDSGDDVQQLCDAGEEEFLEIMALIGMASKPLHVRRLQKALQEWMTNPALFQLPLISINYNEFGPFPTPNPRLLFQQTAFAALRKDITSPDKSNSSLSPGTNEFPSMTNNTGCSSSNYGSTSSSCLNKRTHSPNEAPVGCSSATSSPGPTTPGSPLQLNPVLSDGQLAQISESAKRLSSLLPHVEPKQHSTKKKINKDLEVIMMMAEDNPRRMEGIRKYSAIYGRFDCKRKAEKPLTLHEISVNEAAAQLCKYVPALLTRRDELFPLARQVVRDCDYHRYSKLSIGMSPARTRSVSTNSSDSETTSSGDVSEVPIVAPGSKSPRSVGSSPGR